MEHPKAGLRRVSLKPFAFKQKLCDKGSDTLDRIGNSKKANRR